MPATMRTLWLIRLPRKVLNTQHATMGIKNYLYHRSTVHIGNITLRDGSVKITPIDLEAYNTRTVQLFLLENFSYDHSSMVLLVFFNVVQHKFVIFCLLPAQGNQFLRKLRIANEKQCINSRYTVKQNGYNKP